jgi:hypothetical protein
MKYPVSIQGSRLLGALALCLSLGLASCDSSVQGPDAGSDPLLKGGGSGSTGTTTIPNEVEPNDDPHYNIMVVGSQLGGSVAGVISSATDVDYYLSHGVLPGHEASATLKVPAGRDYDVQILDYNTLQVLASRHLSAGQTESVRWKNQTNSMNEYFFKVFSYDGSSSTTDNYVMTVGKVL